MTTGRFRGDSDEEQRCCGKLVRSSMSVKPWESCKIRWRSLPVALRESVSRSAKLFVEEGAYVFITGRRQKELDAAVKAIGSKRYGCSGGYCRAGRSGPPSMSVSGRWGESMSCSPMPEPADLFHWQTSQRSISIKHSTSTYGGHCSRYKRLTPVK